MRNIKVLLEEEGLPNNWFATFDSELSLDNEYKANDKRKSQCSILRYNESVIYRLAYGTSRINDASQVKLGPYPQVKFTPRALLRVLSDQYPRQ
jgi:hypothetical protein